MIPAMTPVEVHNYLRFLGSEWSGQGCAVELGSWLGATAVPLLEGLVHKGYDKPFWAFDYWRADHRQVKKAALQGVQLSIGQDIRAIFTHNVKPVYDDVNTIQGGVPRTLSQFTEEPIEFCIFDAPKRNPVFIECMQKLEPHFIPGVTVLGLLDFYSYKKGGEDRKAPVDFITENPTSFTMIKDWPGICSCAFFKYEKPISWKQR